MAVKGTLVGLAVCLTAALALVGESVWRGGSAPPTFRLYALATSRTVRLLPLSGSDPASAGHARALTVGSFNADGSPPQVFQSNDGRTVVAVWVMLDQVRVFAAPDGAVRASFQLPVGMQVDGLSPDGSKLFGSTTYAWYSISTATGRVVGRLNLDCCPPLVYDAARGRLFLLQGSRSSAALMAPSSSGPAQWTSSLSYSTGPPGPPRLVAYDLGSARGVASLVLKRVTYGAWGKQSWTPGLAISPNGRQIAVYDGRSNRLTLVDTVRMRILRSESLSESQGIIDRLAEWLGVEPQTAQAKGEERGADLDMRYSPDGRIIYVTGESFSPRSIPRSIGVRAIDADRAEITGQSLANRPLLWSQPAPDGSALYAVVLLNHGRTSNPMLLRLNSVTLQVESQHVVTPGSSPQYYLLATYAR